MNRTIVISKNLGDSDGKAFLESGRIMLSHRTKHVAETFLHELSHMIVDLVWAPGVELPEPKTQCVDFLRDAIRISGVPGNIDDFEEMLCEVVSNETIYRLSNVGLTNNEISNAFIQSFEFSLNVQLDEASKQVVKLYVEKWTARNGGLEKITPWEDDGWDVAYDLYNNHTPGEKILTNDVLDDLFLEDDDNDDYY